MKYFGAPNFGDPSLQPRTAVPAGLYCCWCGELIQVTDSGVVMLKGAEIATPTQVVPATEMPYHEACYVRATVGSVGHQRRLCSCFGGHLEDPPGLTIRQASEAALEETYRQSAHRHARCLGCAHQRHQHAAGSQCVLTGCKCMNFEENIA
jgi:hypothetical protein